MIIELAHRDSTGGTATNSFDNDNNYHLVLQQIISFNN